MTIRSYKRHETDTSQSVRADGACAGSLMREAKSVDGLSAALKVIASIRLSGGFQTFGLSSLQIVTAAERMSGIPSQNLRQHYQQQHTEASDTASRQTSLINLPDVNNS